MLTDCKWRWVRDISATGALEFLADLQRAGRSVQTRNHYLKSAKSFTRWLVRDRRTSMDALAHLSRLNVNTDRRHDRRALSPEEFSRLLGAAHTGQPVESISGPDRAMMYTLAAWTGFRKGEIGSLTLRSLDLDADPPTATVAASFSKRRREDTQVLHPELVTQLKTWIAGKPDLKPDEPLFPVSGRVPGGTDRKTHKMMRTDLEAARKKWIDEAQTERQREERRAIRLPGLPGPRRPLRRLPQLPAPLYHQPGTGRDLAQDGPNAGPAHRHPPHAADLHARRAARPDGGDQGVPGPGGTASRTPPGAPRMGQ